MGEVYLFPRKEKLPKSLEEKMEHNAKEYVEVLYAALTLMSGENPTRERMDEVMGLVNETYLKSVDKAIEELEGES